MKNFIERLEKIKRTERTDQSERGLGYDIGYNMAINNAINIYNELAPEPNKPHTERSFKVRVTKACSSATWYNKLIGSEYTVKQDPTSEEHYKIIEGEKAGSFLKVEDCEIIPETTVIPFDYKRWKDGDYVRVVTRDGEEVKQLTEFDAKQDTETLRGVVCNIITAWHKSGKYYQHAKDDQDLHLEIAKPKTKEYWVNISKVSSGEIYTCHYETEEASLIDRTKNWVKTIKFEI